MEPPDLSFDVSRSAKRARFEIPANYKFEPAKKFYFDSLKDDENGIITRYLSARSNSKYWSRHIDDADVAAAYNING